MDTATDEPLESTDGRRWTFFSVLAIEDVDHPERLYLWRLRIIGTPWFGIYLHHIVSDDGDRPLHDHPWPYVAVTIRGRYLEETDDGKRTLRKIGMPHRHPAVYSHAIRWVMPSTWTLVLTGKRCRQWGFYAPEGWVHHKPFEAARRKKAQARAVERQAAESHYVSTYCIDDCHLQCRLHCKNCNKPCRCSCHTDGRGTPIPATVEELQPA